MKPAPKDIFYVSLQILLFITYLFRITTIDFYTSTLFRYAGLVLSIIGIALIIISSITLKKNLTPFPSPKDNSTLITTGVYKYIRHPIYTGILFTTAGYGVYSENTLRLLVFITMLILFVSKAAYEEALLIKKFPQYKTYKTRTAALFPGLY
ncbi:MAG: isoprenylcysteine carboxylmethyltransferase family protein [Segetibacter sp.]|nr:isoprenylcysteine carboxylmethyltransferase family protein [Segetibacter sp.]